MKEQEKAYLAIGRSLSGSQESQMFGKPCFKTGGKAFMSLINDCVVFKLTGNVHREALSLDGAELFDPSKKGRPMKEWVLVPFDYADQWPVFASAAFDYVKSLNS